MRWVALSILFLVSPGVVADELPADAYPLRNHNPFLQIYGLPSFQTAELASAGRFEFGFSFDVVNDADFVERGGEKLVIDSESDILNFSLRRGIGERFEVGLDVPWVRHSGGSLDSLIYNFHDLFGMSNSSREGPEDQFRLLYEEAGVTLLEMNSDTSGIGDVQLSGAMALGRATLRAGVKLPTGDADKLTGSGATDLSLGLYGGGTTSLFDRDLAYSGFVGVLALGDGDVLPDLQKSAVPYGGAALRWHATPRFALASQLYVQGSYLDVDIDELGGNTVQLAFGGDYLFPDQQLLLRFAIAEDIAGAAAPDVALHLSVRRYSR